MLITLFYEVTFGEKTCETILIASWWLEHQSWIFHLILLHAGQNLKDIYWLYIGICTVYSSIVVNTVQIQIYIHKYTSNTFSPKWLRNVWTFLIKFSFYFKFLVLFLNINTGSKYFSISKILQIFFFKLTQLDTFRLCKKIMIECSLL